MASLIEVKRYKQPATHSVNCEECEGADEVRDAEWIIGTLRLCGQHLLDLRHNIIMSACKE